MFRRNLLISTALLFSLASPAVAQINPDIDNIVIKGTRLNQTASEAGTSVSLITSEDIEALGFNFAIDAIATAPGVTVNTNGAFGGVGSIRIRGASSEQTLVLIDGVVVNDPSSPGGGFDFGRLDTNSIERIEILKGPQSVLWGGDAIGGVVSITTKIPEAGFGASAFAEYGSFSTLRGGGAVTGANDTGDFRIAVTGITTDGISKADEENGNAEDDAFDSRTISAQGGLNLGEARLEARILQTSAETDFDSFVFGAEGNIGDGDEDSETDEISGNISLQLPLLEGRFENLFLLGYSEIDRQNFAAGVPSFGAEGDRTHFRYQGTFTIDPRNTLAFGVEREEVNVGSDDTSIDGLFGLYELKPIKNLTLSAGIRYDDHETFGAETTGRLAVAYNATEQWTLRGTWGQGFKAPTLFQTTFFCCGASEANADVVPETSDGFDVGIDYRTLDGRGNFSASYFDQSVDNLIIFEFAIGGYDNIPGADTSGLELSGAYQFTDWLNVSANYTYLDATDNTGADLIRLPENSGEVIVSLTPEGPVSGAVLIRYNGEELDSSGSVDDWVRVDLTAGYNLNDKIEFYGRIENLFDEQYQQVLGFGTPGISGSVGVRLRY